nr:Protein T01D3.1, isoform b [Haemonchus contortus]
MAEPAQRQSPVEFIRTTTSRAVAAAAPLKPFENTYNQVKANPQPYSVSSEVAVYPGQIVIVDPGTQFELAPGIGFTVQEKGKLYLNGTADQPIRLFGESTWRGVVVKPGGTLVLNHAIIEGASIGLWIDSEKVQVENARIVDSVVHGVEITANAADDVDLGDSVIERPKGSGIGVDERKGSLRIRNVAIKDGWGSGIDFISPAENIRIENVSVTNGSSYSIHVVEFPLLPLKSLTLQNVSVTDQTRGHAGVLVSSGWVEQIDIDQSFFARNTVPSLIIGVESSSVPIVIEKNEFVKNGGEYSVMLSMQGPNAANGSFRANQLRDNINSVASVVLTSPYYRVDGNQFANPLSAHELDVRSNGSWKLQAADNDWVTSDMTKAIKAPEGGVCVCPADRIGLDCSIMIGCPGNCSGNGVCDILNKCICYDGAHFPFVKTAPLMVVVWLRINVNALVDIKERTAPSVEDRCAKRVILTVFMGRVSAKPGTERHWFVSNYMDPN